MANVATFTFSNLLVAAAMLGSAAAAKPDVPARNAFARPMASPACMNDRRPVSQVVYRPSKPDQTIQCSQLLSTDTMLTVHHWDKT